jgi:hypothetical protein
MHMFARAENDLNAAVANFVEERLVPKEPSYQFVLPAIMPGQRLAMLKATLKRLLRVTTKPITGIPNCRPLPLATGTLSRSVLGPT